MWPMGNCHWPHTESVKTTYLSNIARNTSFVVAKARKVARNTLTYVESISPVSVLRACTSRYNVPALIILISNVRHCKCETLSSSRSVPCLGNFNGIIIKTLSQNYIHEYSFMKYIPIIMHVVCTFLYFVEVGSMLVLPISLWGYITGNGAIIRFSHCQ